MKKLMVSMLAAFAGAVALGADSWPEGTTTGTVVINESLTLSGVTRVAKGVLVGRDADSATLKLDNKAKATVNGYVGVGNNGWTSKHDGCSLIIDNGSSFTFAGDSGYIHMGTAPGGTPSSENPQLVNHCSMQVLNESEIIQEGTYWRGITIEGTYNTLIVDNSTISAARLSLGVESKDSANNEYILRGGHPKLIATERNVVVGGGKLIFELDPEELYEDFPIQSGENDTKHLYKSYISGGMNGSVEFRNLDAVVAANPDKTLKIPLLWNKSAKSPAGDFSCSSLPEGWAIAYESGDTWAKYYLTYDPDMVGRIRLTANDVSGINNYSYFYAGKWSDGQVPHGDADYLVPSGTELWLPQSYAVTTALGIKDGRYVFGGKSLTVANGGFLRCETASSSASGYKGVINNLKLKGGAWVYNTSCAPPNWYWFAEGNATIADSSEGLPVEFRSSSSALIHFGIKISGDEEQCIKLCQRWAGADAGGILSFDSDFSDYYGKIVIDDKTIVTNLNMSLGNATVKVGEGCKLIMDFRNKFKVNIGDVTPIFTLDEEIESFNGDERFEVIGAPSDLLFMVDEDSHTTLVYIETDMPTVFDESTGFVYVLAGESMGGVHALIDEDGSNWSDKQAPHGGQNYYSQCGVVLPSNILDYDFPGDMFVLGGNGKYEGGYLRVIGKGATINFNDLRAVSGNSTKYGGGIWSLSGNGDITFTGNLTVYSTVTAPFWLNTGNDGQRNIIAMSVFGKESAYIASGADRNAKANRGTNEFAGDMSEFYGTIENVDETTTVVINTPAPNTTVKITAGALKAAANSDVVIKKLILAEGAKIDISEAYGVQFTVSEEIVNEGEGKILISLGGQLLDSNMDEYYVMQLPEGCEFTVDDFELVDCGVSKGMLAIDEWGMLKIIVDHSVSFVTLEESEDAWISDKPGQSAWYYACKWSSVYDNEVGDYVVKAPQPDLDYYVGGGKTLRAPMSNALVTDPNNPVHNQGGLFNGRSLTFGLNATLLLESASTSYVDAYATVIAKLAMLSGSQIKVEKSPVHMKTGNMLIEGTKNSPVKIDAKGTVITNSMSVASFGSKSYLLIDSTTNNKVVFRGNWAGYTGTVQLGANTTVEFTNGCGNTLGGVTFDAADGAYALINLNALSTAPGTVLFRVKTDAATLDTTKFGLVNPPTTQDIIYTQANGVLTLSLGAYVPPAKVGTVILFK